ncbi:hypothetical protein [Acidithiobacillus sp. AMEEHan]|uniref:tetratricopeptide repeat protein n=1 Tax=Acidithiobacillus sp. AMEEHan TaxID=2994951 RepID=UPI0027E45502|nr:hypothetical protein [Acidithiobacillus sp. AMEEHan]
MTKKDDELVAETPAEPSSNAVDAEVSAPASGEDSASVIQAETESASGTTPPQMKTDTGTTAPNITGSGTSTPKLGAGAAGTTPPGTPPGSGSSYPPLPPRQPRKSVARLVFSWPALVFLLVIIIIILFIWGITANQANMPEKKSVERPSQKTLQVAPIAAPGMATAEPAPKLSADQQQELMSARAAYWHHDIPAAISQYEDLIKKVPDAAFAYGELGNVYYMNGQREKAAENFERAALLLIQQGHDQRAASLIPVLGALDPAMAQKVQVALSHSPQDDGYGADLPVQ